MTPDHPPIWPWAFAILVPLVLYRRLRRSFGRQPLRPTRMIVRMVILALLAASLLPLMLSSRTALLAALAGAALGIALALWGASRTRFLTHNGQLHYIPHTYAGIAVSLLVIGRIVYRFAQAYSTGGFANAAPAGTGSAQVVQNPLTVAILCVLIGYYLYYYGWLLRKSKHVTPADLEPAADATVPGAGSAASGSPPREGN